MLNDLACRHAKPTNKTYRLIDQNNLFLEVRPTGTKSWRFRYSFHGKENNLTIGNYPHVSLSAARRAVEEAKATIKDGNDPNFAKKEAVRKAMYANEQTLELVVRKWHTDFLDTWKEKTGQIILRRFELFIFPHIGSYPIEKITPDILLSCFRRVERHSNDVAERLYKHIQRVFQYAIITGRIKIDPSYGIRSALKKYKKGNFASIDIDKLPELLSALNEHSPRLYRQTSLAVKLLMLTAVRTNELIKAQWNEIDLDKSMWTIPAERMKMELPHLVPLSKQSIKILLELKERNGHREYVFPRKRSFKKPMSNCTIIRVLERIGYKGKMTGHGFRTLFMGISKEKLGYVHDVVDRQLAHVPKGTNGKAYDRATFLAQRIQLMQDFADYIDNPDKQLQRTTNDRATQFNIAPYQFNTSNQTAFKYGGSMSFTQ